MVAYQSGGSGRSWVRQGNKEEVQGKWGSKAEGLNTQRCGQGEQCWEIEMCALGAIAYGRCEWGKE